MAAQSPWSALNQTAGDYDENGMPRIPGYQASFDPRSMSLAQQMSQGLNNINVNHQGIDAYRAEALRQGPSKYAQLATDKENTNEISARSRAQAEANAQRSQGASQLAMSSGMTHGAAERMNRASNNNYLNMSQDIGKQAQQNRQQISMNDEQNRISQLGALPGMENTALASDFQKLQMQGQANQFDIGNQVQEGTRLNAYNMNKYQTQMGAWAANKQADATANAGKK
jgi:hypothetical protein